MSRRKKTKEIREEIEQGPQSSTSDDPRNSMPPLKPYYCIPRQSAIERIPTASRVITSTGREMEVGSRGVHALQPLTSGSPWRVMRTVPNGKTSAPPKTFLFPVARSNRPLPSTSGSPHKVMRTVPNGKNSAPPMTFVFPVARRNRPLADSAENVPGTRFVGCSETKKTDSDQHSLTFVPPVSSARVAPVLQMPPRIHIVPSRVGPPMPEQVPVMQADRQQDNIFNFLNPIKRVLPYHLGRSVLYDFYEDNYFKYKKIEHLPKTLFPKVSKTMKHWWTARRLMDKAIGISEEFEGPVPDSVVRLEKAWLYYGEHLLSRPALMAVVEWAGMSYEDAAPLVEQWQQRGLGLVRTRKGSMTVKNALRTVVSEIQLWKQETHGVIERKTWDHLERYYAVYGDPERKTEGRTEWYKTRSAFREPHPRSPSTNFARMMIFWDNYPPNCYISYIAEWLEMEEQELRMKLAATSVHPLTVLQPTSVVQSRFPKETEKLLESSYRLGRTRGYLQPLLTETEMSKTQITDWMRKRAAYDKQEGIIGENGEHLKEYVLELELAFQFHNRTMPAEWELTALTKYVGKSEDHIQDFFRKRIELIPHDPKPTFLAGKKRKEWQLVEKSSSMQRKLNRTRASQVPVALSQVPVAIRSHDGEKNRWKVEVGKQVEVCVVEEERTAFSDNGVAVFTEEIDDFLQRQNHGRDYSSGEEGEEEFEIRNDSEEGNDVPATVQQLTQQSVSSQDHLESKSREEHPERDTENVEHDHTYAERSAYNDEMSVHDPFNHREFEELQEVPQTTLSTSIPVFEASDNQKSNALQEEELEVLRICSAYQTPSPANDNPRDQPLSDDQEEEPNQVYDFAYLEKQHSAESNTNESGKPQDFDANCADSANARESHSRTDDAQDIAVPVSETGDQEDNSEIADAPDGVEEDVQEAGQESDASITDAEDLAARVDGADAPAETDAPVLNDPQSSSPNQDSRSCDDILNTFIVEWTASQDVDDPEVKAQIEKAFRDVASRYARKPSKHPVAVPDLSEEAGTIDSADATEEPPVDEEQDQESEKLAEVAAGTSNEMSRSEDINADQPEERNSRPGSPEEVYNIGSLVETVEEDASFMKRIIEEPVVPEVLGDDSDPSFPNAVFANDQNSDTSTTGSASPDVLDVPRDDEEPALGEPLAKRQRTNEADEERVEEGSLGRRSSRRHCEPVGQRRQDRGWRAPRHVEEDLQVPSRKRPREEPESSRTTRAIANNNTPVGTRLRTRTAPTQPKRKCKRKAPKDEEEQPSTSTGNAQLPTASNGSVLPEAQARAASCNPDPASSGPHQPQEDRLPEEPPFMKEVRETFKTVKIWNVARQIDFCSRHSIPIEQLRAVLVELRRVHWTDLRNSGAVSDPADYFKKYGNDTFRSGPRLRVPRRKVPKVRRVPAKVPAVPAHGDGERMDQS